jgi:predicted transcriptional regulator of viral defense system
MRKNLGDEAVALYRDARLPILRKLNLPSILRKTLYRHASIHLGAFTVVKDRSLRVSTIGRTFLDMLRKPDLCGGIYHVLEIYEEYAERYLRLIVDEIERHGTSIDKVRTGYVLDERCGLSHPTIDGWLDFVQRGGSRKLYAEAEYSPVFSEKWSLSINIEE